MKIMKSPLSRGEYTSTSPARGEVKTSRGVKTSRFSGVLLSCFLQERLQDQFFSFSSPLPLRERSERIRSGRGVSK